VLGGVTVGRAECGCPGVGFMGPGTARTQRGRGARTGRGPGRRRHGGRRPPRARERDVGVAPLIPVVHLVTPAKTLRPYARMTCLPPEFALLDETPPSHHLSTAPSERPPSKAARPRRPPCKQRRASPSPVRRACAARPSTSLHLGARRAGRPADPSVSGRCLARPASRSSRAPPAPPGVIGRGERPLRRTAGEARAQGDSSGPAAGLFPGGGGRPPWRQQNPPPGHCHRPAAPSGGRRPRLN
jgi:hypothetical protein